MLYKDLGIQHDMMGLCVSSLQHCSFRSGLQMLCKSKLVGVGVLNRKHLLAPVIVIISSTFGVTQFCTVAWQGTGWDNNIIPVRAYHDVVATSLRSTGHLQAMMPTCSGSGSAQPLFVRNHGCVELQHALCTDHGTIPSV